MRVGETAAMDHSGALGPALSRRGRAPGDPAGEALAGRIMEIAGTGKHNNPCLAFRTAVRRLTPPTTPWRAVL